MNAVRPTIVIGIGEAGWKMIDDISNVAEEQLGEAEDAFDYIMIDTSDGDMTHEGPTDIAHPIPIDKPPVQDWSDDVESFHYLSNEMEPLSDGDTGATKQRAIGRYHLEKMDQRADLRRNLSDRIQTHLDEVQALGHDTIKSSTDLSVWVVNSLGGGTGSGTFPIITEIVDNIRRTDIDAETYLYGIGGTPETSVGPRARATLPEPEHRMNTYTALQELEPLVGKDGPHRATRINGHPQPRFPSVDLDNPYKQYFLLGHDLSEDRTQYLSQINRVAGILITFMSQLGNLEDFPSEFDLPDQTLWAIDAYQIHAPVTQSGDETSPGEHSVESIVDNLNEIEDLRSQIDDLKEEKQTFRNARNFIEDLDPNEVNYEAFDSERIAAETVVPPDFLTQLRTSANELSFDDIYSDEEGKQFNVDDEIDRHASDNEVVTYLPDVASEVQQSIVQLVYSKYLQIRVERIQQNHEFYEALEDEWKKLKQSDRIRTDENAVGTFDQYGNDPLSAYRQEVADALDEILDEYEEKKENQGMLGGLIGTDWEEKYDDMEERVQKLNDLENEYAILQDVASTASSRASTAWSELEDWIDEFKTRIQTKKEDVEKRRGAINTNMRSIGNAVDAIQQDTYEDRYFRVPVTDVDLPESIDMDNTEEIEDAARKLKEVYAQYDEAGNLTGKSVETDDLVSSIEQALNELDSPPIQDENAHEVETAVGVATAGVNVSGQNSLLSENIMGELSVRDVFDRTGEFNQDRLSVDTADGFSFWILGLYTNLTIEKMNEVKHFHDHFFSKDKDISETNLGRRHHGINDEELATRFAYPEFLPEDKERYVRDIGKLGERTD